MARRLLFGATFVLASACSLAVTESDYVGGKRSAAGDDGGADAGSDSSVDAAPIDDFDAGPKCSLDTPFGAPILIKGLELEETYQPRLSRDELTIYFANAPSASPQLDIHFATRTKRTEAFGPKKPLTRLNTASAEGSPIVSADGKLLLFTSDRGAGPFHLYVASATSDPDNPFDNPQALGTIAGADGEGRPYLSADGSELYFQDLVTTSKIFRARMSPEGTASMREQVTGIGSTTDTADGAPILTYDGLGLYFLSTRDGGDATYRASRPTKADAWRDVEKVPEVSGVDALGWISPDNCRLYVDRPDGSVFRPYVLERSP